MYEEILLDRLSSATNRSLRQTQFLFELVERNLTTLIQLEEQIGNCFIAYCPDNKDQIDKILSLTPRSNHFQINFIRLW
ncbi:MAG: hypothetical protein KDH96_03590 [Candidatus Riesia sp.]|nr:hypothetical protein [Romboutsia sp.]MCB1711580.1 hypothetical protein [Candidatus Riesia sp.]